MKFGFGSVPFLAGVTPAGPSWVAVGAPGSLLTPAPSHPFPVPAGAQVGDMLILLLNNWDVPTSVTTNTGQTLTSLGAYSSAGELCQAFGVVITGSVPTTITAAFGSSVQILYQVAVARGVTAAGGLINNGVSFSAITTAPYTATVSSSLVLTMLSSQPNTSNLTAAVINGSDPATVTDGWEDVIHVITGVNTSAAGARTMGLTFSAATTSGRWFSLELVP